MCRVLKVARSSVYKWKNSRQHHEEKLMEDGILKARITLVFQGKHGLYGGTRTTAQLNACTGFAPVNHKRVARVMQALHLHEYSKNAGGNHGFSGFNACVVDCWFRRLVRSFTPITQVCHTSRTCGQLCSQL